MHRSSSLSRRNLLVASLLLPLAGSRLARASTEGGQAPSGSKVLVAYFSRTGNTRVVARQIRRAQDADLFEIEPATPYPEDYEETVAMSRRESDTGHEPPLKARVANLAGYDTVFLGFPIWSQTAPPVIRSFLSNHDLSGKTVVPFITHGGYGVGNSLTVLARNAPRAQIVDAGFVLQADQERQTLERVTRWLGDVEARVGK